MDCVSSSNAESEGRVVVAENDPIVAGALSWLLREQGFVVTTVNERDALIESLERVLPDLLVVDADMVAHEPAILPRIKADERWHDVRVIVAATNDDEGEPTLPAGADDYVHKPFRVPELLGRVRTQLRASDQLRTARAAL